MIITLIIGGFLGGFVNQFVTKPTKQESSTVSDEFQEFLNTYEDIKENYYEEIDEGEMLNAGIKGMIDYLGDKYSVYMDEEETEEFNEQVEGKYVGIGTEIMQLEDGSVVVSNPFEGSPAAKAGLQAGDVIIRVNDTDVTGKTSSEVSNLIKKSADSTVNITVRRDDEEKTFTIERETIEIESVDSSVFDVNDKKVGYIYISIFAANTYQQFEQALEDLEKDGIDSLVIDVRSNSGGYLDCVTEIASLFLGKGKVIYQLDTKGIVEKVYDETKTKRDYPIAVLINSSSASASEILAASLKESYGAEVVGVNSYGKGTVQRAYQLENGATVKYTIQKWLTPDGNWINEVGVEPTLRVEMNVDYYQNPSDETDNQLQEALKKVAE